MQTFQLVTNPADFESELLKQLIFEPPVEKEKYRQVEYRYLAVFEKTVNLPGDKYRELLESQFEHEDIVKGLLTEPSGFQHGFGGDEEDVIVDTWYFKGEGVDDEKPLMVVVVIARVDPPLTPETEMIL